MIPTPPSNRPAPQVTLGGLLPEHVDLVRAAARSFGRDAWCAESHRDYDGNLSIVVVPALDADHKPTLLISACSREVCVDVLLGDGLERVGSYPDCSRALQEIRRVIEGTRQFDRGTRQADLPAMFC